MRITRALTDKATTTITVTTTYLMPIREALAIMVIMIDKVLAQSTPRVLIKMPKYLIKFEVS